MLHTHDAIVIGQGLAGSALTEQLLRRGLRVRVFDAPRAGNASQVAAGVVNPIVLRRMLPSWRCAEMLDVAEPYYRTLEERQEQRFWHPLELVRLFATQKEATHWANATADPGTAPFLSLTQRKDVDRAPIDRGAGYGIVKRCAWFDVAVWLAAQRAELIRSGVLHDAWINEAEPIISEEGIRVEDASAPWLFDCAGPFANEVKGLSLVRGELLTVRIPELRVNSMLHRNVFVLPLGDDLYRVGSTFTWTEPFLGPTEEGRNNLLQRLQVWVQAPVEVVDHQAGVRPASMDRRPILGRSQRSPRVFVLNGLGARGVLLAPWCAQHLLAHVFDGAVLDTEVDVVRFG